MRKPARGRSRDRRTPGRAGKRAPARPELTAPQARGQARGGPGGRGGGRGQRGGAGPHGLEVYGDSAYGTGAARAAYQRGGHDTVIKPKPLLPAVPGGFTLDDFTIDEAAAPSPAPAGTPAP